MMMHIHLRNRVKCDDAEKRGLCSTPGNRHTAVCGKLRDINAVSREAGKAFFRHGTRLVPLHFAGLAQAARAGSDDQRSLRKRNLGQQLQRGLVVPRF